VDAALSTKAWDHLEAIDRKTARRMKYAHQKITQAYLNLLKNLPHSYQGTNQKYLRKHEDNCKTSKYRLGGFGSVMALSESSGEGTSFHYDEGDDSRLHILACSPLLTNLGGCYSTIAVLGVGGMLQLPELGLEIEVLPGDVVCFLASQQLHRLTVDQTTPGLVQKALTLWNDARSMELAHERYSSPAKDRISRRQR
jgi:hypothetical protein